MVAGNIADQNIKQVDHTKFLGVYIRWKIVLEISYQLCFNESIKNRRNNRKSKTLFRAWKLKELYNTTVYPYATYCKINWASTYPTRLRLDYLFRLRLDYLFSTKENIKTQVF